jgi:hypothetical protein
MLFALTNFDCKAWDEFFSSSSAFSRVFQFIPDISEVGERVVDAWMETWKVGNTTDASMIHPTEPRLIESCCLVVDLDSLHLIIKLSGDRIAIPQSILECHMR